MLLFRVSATAVDHQANGESVRTKPGSPGPHEPRREAGKAMGAFSPMTIDEGELQAVARWPQISEVNAKKRIPRFAKIDAPESHGGSTFRKKRTLVSLCGKRGPAKRVADSKNMKFLLGEKAQLPRDEQEAVRIVSENEPHLPKDFWREQIDELEATQSRKEPTSGANPPQMKNGWFRGS